MRILITGGTGYIGSHVAHYLGNRNGHELTLVDIRPVKASSLGEFFRIDLSNLSELDRLFSAKGYHAVIHFAGVVNPQHAAEAPLECYHSNVANTISLLQLCIKHRVNRFIYPSSSAVYGHQADSSIGESAPKRALNSYGHSKIMCEQIIEDVGMRYPEFKYAILRHFLVAGADNTPVGIEAASRSSNPIRIAVQAALGLRDKMQIFGGDYDTPDGTCVRDYAHIEDMTRLYHKILTYLEHGESTVFNASSGTGSSLLQVVQMVKEVSDCDFEVQIGGRRDNDYVSLVADMSKAKRYLDWEPRCSSLRNLCKCTLDFEKLLNRGTTDNTNTDQP